MHYPARFKPDPAGGFVVSFRDIPEAITQGETLEEAYEMALDALITALDFYFEDQREVPLPSSPKRGDRFVVLPASVWAKVLLLNLMLKKSVKKSELAKLINIKPQEMTRLIDLRHATKIDQLQRAVMALGAELQITLASP